MHHWLKKDRRPYLSVPYAPMISFNVLIHLKIDHPFIILEVFNIGIPVCNSSTASLINHTLVYIKHRLSISLILKIESMK